MSDPASPVWPPGPAADAAPALTPEAVERVLGDLRVWLTDVAAVPAPTAEPPAVDLHTLVAQFTALRHEVNLQTKASRTAVEQNAEALKQLGETVEELRERPQAAEDEAGPLLKGIVDVYDNLVLALRQVEKQRKAIDEPLDEWVTGTKLPEFSEMTAGLPHVRPGFWWRLFGASSVPKLQQHPEIQAALARSKDLHQRTAEAAKLVRSSFDGLIAGYRMSLARIERVLGQTGLEPISAVGEPFVPELMEVVEVVGGSDRPANEVIEEVRRGYLRGDVVFRYAQVKVAR
jgi:molecular chaperone GrpE